MDPYDITMLIIWAILIILIVWICSTNNKPKEGLMDQCTTLDGGDTDAIKQAREWGRQDYAKWLKKHRDSPQQKRSCSGGGLLNSVTLDRLKCNIIEDSLAKKLGQEGFVPLEQSLTTENQYYGDLCRGDQRMAEKMKDMSQQAQRSIINRAKYHKHSLLPYLAEELDAIENVEWWDDLEDLEHTMIKDGKVYA